MRNRQADPNLGRAGISPSVEVLEDRTCPSSVVLNGHNLLITGNSSSEVITVSDGGDSNVKVSVLDSGGHVLTRSLNGVESIQIKALGENDRVDYALTGALTVSESINIDLGSGNNTAVMNFGKGVSAPALRVSVVGGKNDDTLQAVFGTIHNSNVDFETNLGDGNDHVFANFNGDLTGTAHVLFRAISGSGYDGIAVNVTANIEDHAFLDVESQGGAHSDTMHLDYQGRLNGTLVLHEQGGPQFSWLESSVTLEASSTGNLMDEVVGGRGDENLLILRVHDLSHHMHSIYSLIDGGGGAGDMGVVTPGVKVVRASLS
jgi:hypothetical protein